MELLSVNSTLFWVLMILLCFLVLVAVLVKETRKQLKRFMYKAERTGMQIEEIVEHTARLESKIESVKWKVGALENRIDKIEKSIK